MRSDPIRLPGRTSAGSLALLAALAPTPALAHASERMIILTLPTGHYIVGAAAVVALTALLVVLAPRLPTVPPPPAREFPDAAGQPRQLVRLSRPRGPGGDRLFRHAATPWAIS